MDRSCQPEKARSGPLPVRHGAPWATPEVGWVTTWVTVYTFADPPFFWLGRLQCSSVPPHFASMLKCLMALIENVQRPRGPRFKSPAEQCIFFFSTHKITLEHITQDITRFQSEENLKQVS